MSDLPIERQKRGAFTARLGALRKHVPILSPALVLILIFCIGGLLFKNFFSARVILNLFTDNAFLGVAAVGMTFAIICPPFKSSQSTTHAAVDACVPLFIAYISLACF